MPEIILRKEAREQGLTKYFTGKPCKNGHLEERNTHSGICYGCSRLQNQKYVKTDKGKKAIKRASISDAMRRAQANYRRSSKGKQALKKGIKKYKETDKGKEAQTKATKKYSKSKLGIETTKKYQQSDAYKEKRKRYVNSELGKKTLEKYKKTEAYKISEAKYRKKKLSTVAGRMERNIRVEMFKVLKSKGLKKSQRLINLIGCSIGELINHLTNNFYNRKNGEVMSMDNYSKKGWHVDHIVPVNYFLKNFDYGNDKSIERICWHYTNLRPLWSEDNIAKSDKISEENAKKKIAEIRKLINV